MFGGFDDPESDALAFATMVGTSNDRFAIMVNLPMAEEDPDEFRLTLAHEVSHVFSQTPTSSTSTSTRRTARRSTTATAASVTTPC